MRSLITLFAVTLGISLALPCSVTAQQKAQPETVPATPIPALESAQPGDSDKPQYFYRAHPRDLTKVGSDLVLKEGENVGKAVVVYGDAAIDGDVDRDLVVVSGNLVLNSKVRGNVVVVLGSVKFGPKAEIGRDLVLVGGNIESDAGVKIGGDRVEIGLLKKFPILEGSLAWIKSGLILGRPLPPGVRWVWMVAGIFLVINVLVSLMFPRSTQACVTALDVRPIGSLFAGLLLLILFGPVLALLVFSGVGIIVVPFFLCGLIVAFLLGKVAIYQYAGLQIGKQFGVPALQAPLTTLLFGTAIFYVLYTIPIIGMLAWAVISLVGVGSVLVASAGGLRREVDRNRPATFTPPSSSGSGMPGVSAGPGAIPPSVEAPLGFARVGFWARACAMALDLVLIIFLTIPTHFPPFFLLAWAAYHVGMWTWKGTTIGGIVMGIKVVRTDGRPVDFAVAVVRAIASVFSALVFGLGFFWAGWSRDKQSWHDKIAGTVIVRVPREIALI